MLFKNLTRRMIRASAITGAIVAATASIAAPAQSAQRSDVCEAVAREGNPSPVGLLRYPAAASPWKGTRKTTPGPLVLVRHGTTRVGTLCDSSGSSWRTPIVLRPGERLGRISLADPWVSWTVYRDRRRATVRTARLGRRTAVGRVRVRGTVRDLAVTVDGNTAVAAAIGSTRRFFLLRPGGRSSRLRTPTPIPGAAMDRLGVGRWGTRELAFRDGRAGASRDRAFPIDPRRDDLTARCRPSAPDVLNATTTALQIHLADSLAWARSASPTEKHLAICDAGGRLLYGRYLDLPGDGFLETDGPEVYSRSSVAIAVAGPIVLVREVQVTGITGTGTDTNDVRAGFVVRSSGTVRVLQPSLVVGTESAAAFVDDGRLWLFDAEGLRIVPTTRPLTERNTALILQSGSLLVRTPGFDERVPFRALAAGNTAALVTERGYPRMDGDDLCGSSYSSGNYSCNAAPGSPSQLEDPSSPPVPTE